MVFKPNYSHNAVFSIEESNLLAIYLKKSSKLAYGLTTKQTREFAYQYASKLNKTMPKSWHINKIAGADWFLAFMKKNPTLSLRAPESTSLSRATSFNQTNVNIFINNLYGIYEKYEFTPEKIFNTDETGIPTVLALPKVIAQKGEKQVAQAVSAERGELVTMLGFVNAIGNSIPPVMIFPRVHFKEHMIKGAPSGTLGLATASGWMNGDCFLKSLEHFVKYVKCKPTKEDRVLLLLDNHDSHVNIDVVMFAREHGIIILTIPPHCSHKLQPLDISIYGPFKARLKVAMNDWHVLNPGKTCSIYDIADLVGKAYPLTFTMKNIIAGFSKPGIWPFNRHVFTEADFLTAFVTDRPISEGYVGSPGHDDLLSIMGNEQTGTIDINQPSISQTNVQTIQSSPISPEIIRPYPKAQPRKQNITKRKKGKSRIITDTPEQNEMLEAMKIREERKRSAEDSKARKCLQKSVKGNKLEEKDESEDESDIAEFTDESEASIDQDIGEKFDFNKDSIQIGDYVLVQFLGKKMKKYYIGVVIDKDIKFPSEITVKYMRRKESSNKFIFPDKEDIGVTDLVDVMYKLPKPQNTGTTSRVSSVAVFEINFGDLTIM